MQGFRRFALHLVPGFLVMCWLSFGGQCVAQEVNVPTGRGSGSIAAPTGWVELIAPVQKRVDLKFYGSISANWEHQQHRLTPLFGRRSFFRSLPAISIIRSLQAGLINLRIIRQDLLA